MHFQASLLLAVVTLLFGSGSAQTGDARLSRFPVSVHDIVAALPGDVDHMDVARASRIWRKGVIRTYIAGNTPPTPEVVAEGLLHNETWAYYPDDKPRRSMYAGDTRAGLVPFLAHAHFGDTYSWLLYMDDDTVFFPPALLHLLRDFDPAIPYFITDHLWYANGTGPATHPHPQAPRCLPCHFDEALYARRRRSFPAPRGCPCTPQLLCAAAPRVFNAHCDIPRHPANTFSMHGGAGAVLSAGLLRAVGLDFMEACSLSLQSTGGDAFISICLWQAGYFVTDPGLSVFMEGVHAFDPGPEDRLGAMRLLAAYIDGHREGADRHWVTTCDEACERQLGAMVSLHIRSRSFAALDDAASFIKAITTLYEASMGVDVYKLPDVGTAAAAANGTGTGAAGGGSESAESLEDQAHRLAMDKTKAGAQAAEEIVVSETGHDAAAGDGVVAAAGEREQTEPSKPEPRVGVGVVVLRELSPGNPETLLIRRAKAPNKGDWCFPGGSLELGETLVQCAVRETLEETGLRLRCRLPQAEHGQPDARHPPLSPDLAYPSSFIAGDAITYDDAGALAFHYAIVNVAGVPENPEAAVVPGDDAADARWFPVTDLRGLKVADLVPTCDFVAEEAVRRFAIR
ncbi:hypothetical protein F751_0357 [Auxenochlorella protothecoides]|uniref:Nudix hydrolase domain-containing protein n=1 Tax=Auxenochlorella protothecoides TaxID=3075 RepID=A0A087SB95_AUXPR|nr:hypothetical protein F751_0357 [Auxenochlorella protothecoides]KFM22999.1 hypothetical protein F751_0357 [Auxenochlorella protothecoides]